MKTNENAVAVLDKVIVPQSKVHQRPLDTVRKELNFLAGGKVEFRPGAQVNVYEVIELVTDGIAGLKSQGITIANTLRLARQLPDVKVVTGGGEKALVTTAQPAYDFALEKVRETVKDSTFYNVVELVMCIDVKEKNGWESSPFAIKEALPTLAKLKLLNDETGKVKGNGSIAKALKEGTGANAIRPIIAKVKEANPSVFKKTASVTAKPDAPLTNTDTVDKVSMDLTIIIGRVDKLNASVGVQAMRNAASDKVRDLAKLFGFKVELIEAAKASGVAPEKTLEAMKPIGKK